MKAVFKKGEQITWVEDYDSKGTVVYHQCTVHSCGAKVLRIINNATGKLLGAAFRPAIGDGVGFFPYMDDATARAHCLEQAARIVAEERERYLGYLEDADDATSAYSEAIRKHIAALHAPRVFQGSPR